MPVELLFSNRQMSIRVGFSPSYSTSLIISVALSLFFPISKRNQLQKWMSQWKENENNVMRWVREYWVYEATIELNRLSGMHMLTPMSVHVHWTEFAVHDVTKTTMHLKGFGFRKRRQWKNAITYSCTIHSEHRPKKQKWNNKILEIMPVCDGGCRWMPSGVITAPSSTRIERWQTNDVPLRSALVYMLCVAGYVYLSTMMLFVPEKTSENASNFTRWQKQIQRLISTNNIFE